jgi:hypothetical protein
VFDIVDQSTEEGDVLYDGNRRTLGEVVPLEQADVETTAHLRIGFWQAFERLRPGDADIISLMMYGFKYKDISEAVHNARYRIKIARKRFKAELEREGIDVGKR